MKKIILVIAILAKSSLALASSGLLDENCSECNANSTHYAQLAALFQKGEIVKAEELVGAFSGRCYGIDAQDTAINELLVGHEETIGADQSQGPLFPGESVIKVLVVQHKVDGQPADFFDNNLSADDQKELNTFLDATFKEATVACEKDGSLVVGISGNNRLLRKSQGYIISSYGTYNYCYFFKKIQ